MGDSEISRQVTLRRWSSRGSGEESEEKRCFSNWTSPWVKGLFRSFEVGFGVKKFKVEVVETRTDETHEVVDARSISFDSVFDRQG